MRVLITGSEGFIGSALVKALEGHQVTGYDLQDGEDILNKDMLSDAMEGSEVVVHCASIAGVDHVKEDPIGVTEVILNGTQNVYSAARTFHVKRVVNLSTSEVFGQFANYVDEGMATTLGAVGEARWAYAISKLAMEHMGAEYSKRGLPVVSVRPFNVFGPGQEVGSGAVKAFVQRAVLGQPLNVYGGGGQIRSWTYITDMVSALKKCVELPLGGMTLNIGNPHNTLTIFDLANRINKLAGSTAEVYVNYGGEADVEFRSPRIGKAVSVLGWRPEVDLDTGLLRTIEYFREAH